MQIRPVRPSDRAEWLRLLMDLYADLPESEHVAAMDAFLSGAPSATLIPSAVFVCERPEGGLAGVLELSVRDYAEGCTGRTPFVESWYVDRDARGQGVGRALVEAAEQWARERGYTEIASDALLDNRESLQAHEAVGFEEVERAVHYRKDL